MKNDVLRVIDPSELVCLDDFTDSHPLKIDLVYAKPSHKDNIFKEAIYRPDAKMWVHEELLPIVLEASKICFKEYGFIFELKDCLRTTDSQIKITNTKIVKANPHWLQEPRLFSNPGAGGHPRGMAIDIILIDNNGDEIDMGTPFDFLAEDPNNNPAARNYTKFSNDENYNKIVITNRLILEKCITSAAKKLNTTIKPLTVEWWDFRFELPYLKTIKPLSDADLPPEMQMTLNTEKTGP